jgi:outer membrane immunogenic protein
MRKLAVALLAGVSFGVVTVASAADMPARMRTKAPVAPAFAPIPFTWSGFYVGGNLGWGWTDGDGTITMGGASGPTSGSGDGFLGGVQAGYNWQTGSFVFGVETDFQGSTGSGGVNSTAGATTSTATGKTPWFGTIRGRVGYAFDRYLVYATGGGLYGKSTLDGTLNTTGPFSSSSTYWTWVAGAGIETHLWDRWTGKIEYLYAGTPDHVPVPPGTSGISGNTHTNIVRVGLNYHF